MKSLKKIILALLVISALFYFIVEGKTINIFGYPDPENYDDPRFPVPRGLAFDEELSLYVLGGGWVDDKMYLKKIKLDGSVVTIRDDILKVDVNPSLYYDIKSKEVYISGNYVQKIKSAYPNETVTESHEFVAKSFLFDKEGGLYVLTSENIIKFRLPGDSKFTDFAGSIYCTEQKDGIGIKACLGTVEDITMSSGGFIYFSETSTNSVVRISPDSTVERIAGGTGGGDVDGQGTNAKFKKPTSIAVDSTDIVYIVDFDAKKLKIIDSNFQVSTLIMNVQFIDMVIDHYDDIYACSRLVIYKIVICSEGLACACPKGYYMQEITQKCVKRPIETILRVPDQSLPFASPTHKPSVLHEEKASETALIKTMVTVSSKSSSSISLTAPTTTQPSNFGFDAYDTLLKILIIIFSCVIISMICYGLARWRLYRVNIRRNSYSVQYHKNNSYQDSSNSISASNNTSSSWRTINLDTSSLEKSSSSLAKTTSKTAYSKTKTSTQISISKTSSSGRTIEVASGLSIPAFLLVIPNHDFSCTRRIARGGGGEVYLGNATNPDLQKYGSTVIVKECRSAEKNQVNFDVFLQEVSIMYLLRNHRNICKLLGFSEKPYMMVLKYYPFGSLADFIRVGTSQLSKKQLIRWCSDITKGLGYMHENGIAHCDIKPANILLDCDKASRELFCVLTDFGISFPVNDKSQNVHDFRTVVVNGASFLYASPEALVRVLHQKKNTIVEKSYFDALKCDIFSFSMVAMELMIRSRIDKLWLLLLQ